METVNLIPDNIGPSPPPLYHKKFPVTISVGVIVAGLVCSILFFLIRSCPVCLFRSISNRSTRHREDEDQNQDDEHQDDHEDKLAVFPAYTYAETTLSSRSFVSSERESCAVCLAEYVDTDIVRVLPSCKHMFHKNCIDQWLRLRSSNCPMCRHQTIQHHNLELITISTVAA